MIKHRTIPHKKEKKEKKGGSSRGLELKRDDGEKKKKEFYNRKPERRNARYSHRWRKRAPACQSYFHFTSFFLFFFLPFLRVFNYRISSRLNRPSLSLVLS